MDSTNAVTIKKTVLFLIGVLLLTQADALAQAEQPTADQLVAVLESDASLHDKAVACKQLAVVGTKENIPLLAELLSNEELAHYARFALEAIPDPAVDQALRDALPQLSGELLIGVVNSIGQRKDAASIDALVNLLGNSDENVAAAAAGALGRIGGSRVAELLKEKLPASTGQLQTAIADACLTCADGFLASDEQDQAVELYDLARQTELPKHIRVAATRAAILARGSEGVALLSEQLKSEDRDFFEVALSASRQTDAADVTEALLSELENLPPTRKAAVVVALGDRGDRAALSAVVGAAKSDSNQVRLAAIRALRQLGDASVVSLLLEAAAESDDFIARAAQATLANLPGDAVDKALTANLGSDPRFDPVLIDLVGARRIDSAVPELFEAAKSSSAQVRLAAIEALGETVSFDQIDLLISRSLTAQSAEQDAAVAALKAACIRMPDREACAKKLATGYSNASAEQRSDMFNLLLAMGGPTALDIVSDAAREGDDADRDAATRVLGDWQTADAAPALLDLAKTLEEKKYKVRALRGYIRIPRQFGLPDNERLAMCRNALRAAERDEERKLVLDVLRRIHTPVSLLVAVATCDNPALKNAAANTALSIAERIVDTEPTIVATAMRRLLQLDVGKNLESRATALLEKAND